MADLTSIAWGGKTFGISQGFGVYGGPLAGWYGYSSNYGWPAGYHIGIDVATPKLTSIYSVNPGTVIRSGFSDSFRPSPVFVEEDDTGNVAIYGHLWESLVSVGQHVKRGQLLGKSGEQTFPGTWNPDGSGAHIHFEYRVPDTRYPAAYRAVDPIPVLTKPGSIIGGTNGGTPFDFDFDFEIPNLSEGVKRVGIGIVGALGIALGARTIVRNR